MSVTSGGGTSLPAKKKRGDFMFPRMLVSVWSPSLSILKQLLEATSTVQDDSHPIQRLCSEKDMSDPTAEECTSSLSL